MLQLYAFDQAGVRHEIDTYETDPIKITISAESITDIPEINSAFSRQFRVPANQNNSRFFKYYYTSGIADFDVTQRVPADIYVDGLFYASGHLRLENVYSNEEESRVDFELLFLAQTKDFASEVGEGFMSDLDVTDLSHNLTPANVQNSWLNFGAPSLFLGGKLRWILADRGLLYDSDGQPTSASQINAESLSWSAGGTFVNSATPLPLNMFTPIVQVKYLIDQMFAKTGYTFSADSFFNSQLFKFLYTDGVNVASPVINGTVLELEAVKTNTQQIISDTGLQPVNFTEVSATGAFVSPVYTVQSPVTGASVDVSLQYFAEVDVPSVPVEMEIRIEKNGALLGTAFTDISNFDISGTATLFVTANFVQGDEIRVTASATNAAVAFVTNGTLDIIGMGNVITGQQLMKNDVKQLEFFRSILTRFRLVMVPNKSKPTEFIIKPWAEYIASGDVYDWTAKLDTSRDTQMKPVFFDQSATILYTDVEDTDVVNFFNQQSFNFVYGRRLFDSQNELLDSQRRIQTIFAPTPVDQILGVADTSNYIVPILAVADGKVEIGSPPELYDKRNPLRPKPRLLFFNGLITTNPSVTWFYTNGVTTFSSVQYPMASYLSAVPTFATVMNLSWQKQFAYFQLNGGPLGDGGKDVFTLFWSDYIDSLYSPEARFLTAYFKIDAEDLRDLSFDDVIFVKDTYWRVHKIYDAPLTDTQVVKVDLIKLLNYSPDDVSYLGAPAGFDQYPEDQLEEPLPPVVFEEVGGPGPGGEEPGGPGPGGEEPGGPGPGPGGGGPGPGGGGPGFEGEV